MRFPSILEYNGPQLDIAGNFFEGQKSAILRRADQREQDEYERKQSDREKMEGILGSMKPDATPEEIAGALLTVSPETANKYMDLAIQQEKIKGMGLDRDATRLSMQNTRLGMQHKRLEIQAEEHAQANERQYEQLSTETSLLQSALENIDGIADPKEAEESLNKYFKTIDVLNQDREKQGLNPIQIPDMLKTGTIQERVELMQGMHEVGEVRLQALNKAKAAGLDPTSEIKNFLMSQSNPEFADFLNEQNATTQSTPASMQVADRLGSLRKQAIQAEQAGDMDGAESAWTSYNELYQSAKLGEKGMEVGAEGVSVAPGFEDFLKRRESAKAEGGETGKGDGVAINAYEDFVAALPGLEETAAKLIKLADASTYTAAGKFNDSLKRQIGVEVGDAAEARAELISTIDVEVLPLLKPTFGAQFTVTEGEWLKNTLMDPDSSPSEKKAQIRARVKGWKKEGERLSRRTGKEVPENMFKNVVAELGIGESQTISLEEFLNEDD